VVDDHFATLAAIAVAVRKKISKCALLKHHQCLEGYTASKKTTKRTTFIQQKPRVSDNELIIIHEK